MSNKNINIEEDVAMTPDEVMSPDVVYATIVKEDDGYHVIDADGAKSDVCPLTKDQRSICLPKNASNRQWMSVVRLNKWFETSSEPFPLTYKATRVIGAVGTRKVSVPNAKLISYLSEELQAEYKAIIDKAIAARDADKKKPLTEEEKLRAKIAKLQAQLEGIGTEADA